MHTIAKSQIIEGILIIFLIKLNELHASSPNIMINNCSLEIASKIIAVMLKSYIYIYNI